jgi:tRNA-specific 2-thiouridylase
MRIAVAMSGGVDSSVAALLLKEAGHEVVGLSMQLWDHSGEAGRSGRCCTLDDLSDARRVAWALGIRHYCPGSRGGVPPRRGPALRRSYLAGETPIPCSACNTKVKFATLWDRARRSAARPSPRALRARRDGRLGACAGCARARPAEGPVVLSCTTSRRTSSRPRVSGGRTDEGGGPRACPPREPPDRRQGGEPGDLLRSRRRRARAVRGGARGRARADPPGAEGRIEDAAAGAWARTPATTGSRSDSGGASASPRPNASTFSPSTPRRTASSSARAAIWRRARPRSRRRWIGATPDAPFAAAARIRHPRPTRPPRCSRTGPHGARRLRVPGPRRHAGPGVRPLRRGLRPRRGRDPPG